MNTNKQQMLFWWIPSRHSFKIHARMCSNWNIPAVLISFIQDELFTKVKWTFSIPLQNLHILLFTTLRKGYRLVTSLFCHDTTVYQVVHSHSIVWTILPFNNILLTCYAVATCWCWVITEHLCSLVSCCSEGAELF